jgi:hypothetical protein
MGRVNGMLPGFRFVIGATVAAAMLAIVAIGLFAAARMTHQPKVGPLETSRNVTFDDRTAWNQFADPDSVRRFEELAERSTRAVGSALRSAAAPANEQASVPADAASAARAADDPQPAPRPQAGEPGNEARPIVAGHAPAERGGESPRPDLLPPMAPEPERAPPVATDVAPLDHHADDGAAAAVNARAEVVAPPVAAPPLRASAPAPVDPTPPAAAALPDPAPQASAPYR